MDYPLQYTENNLQENASGANQQSNYRSYGVFNDTSLMFDNNNNNNNNNTSSPILESHEDNSRTLMLMSTRPPPIMHDPWTQHQLMTTAGFNPNDPLDNPALLHHHISHSERGIAGFVSKLYQCLQSSDSSYARWCQHDGKDMFIIDCIPEFTEVVLPRLFKHCKFPSFVRQLNIYGFQRDTDARKSKDTKDKESCRWYHPWFRPGRRDLFHLIRRKATRYSRKKRVKAEEDPETILNLGSGDESEAEEQLDQVHHQHIHHQQQQIHHSSSASPVNPTLPVDYNNATSQLQLGFVEQQQQQQQSPNNMITTPKEFDHDNLLMLREEELRLEIFHLKQDYDRMHGHFEEQLGTARIQIEEQTLRIQQLEGLLGQQRQLMPTNNNNNNNTSATGNTNTANYTLPFHNNTFVSPPPRLVNGYEMTENESNTPKPDHYNNNNNNNNNNNGFYYSNDKLKADTNEHLLHTPPLPTTPGSTLPTRTASPQATWSSFKHVVADGSNHTENTILENDKTHRKSSQMNFNSYM